MQEIEQVKSEHAVMLKALQRIAGMTDRDGNAIEMHREELRGVARTALAGVQTSAGGIAIATENANQAPVTYMTEEQAEAWAWKQVVKDLELDKVNIGEKMQHHPFFLAGWRYRSQFEKQRPAAPDSVALLRKELEAVGYRFESYSTPEGLHWRWTCKGRAHWETHQWAPVIKKLVTEGDAVNSAAQYAQTFSHLPKK